MAISAEWDTPFFLLGRKVLLGKYSLLPNKSCLQNEMNLQNHFLNSLLSHSIIGLAVNHKNIDFSEN